MSSKHRRSKKGRAKPRRGPTPSHAAVAPPVIGQPEDDGYLADWARSRAGATAARGFHYQDAVGAWIAAQVAVGSINGVLVPEGLDDMTIEAQEAINVQIKSRVLRRGPFRPAEAASHILDAWETNVGRSRPSHLVWVVLENGVATPEILGHVEHVLRDALLPDSPLRAALAVEAAKSSRTVDLDECLSRTVALGLSWSQLDSATDLHLDPVVNAPPAGRTLVARSLRVEIADTTDANTTRDAAQRRRLDRTDVVRHIHAVSEQIDVDALEEALREGVCAPLDRASGGTTGDSFYEGVSTQPGHVSEGLVVLRRDLSSEVIVGVQEGGRVIITGPSGVGKSALLWTVPEALPGVAWFRVNRLQSPADTNRLLRLARAHGASDERPVGFLVDGLGLGGVTDWASLRAAAATQPGVVLLATARNEDLVSVGDLADTRTVDVTLDESSASTIFEGLQRRGVAVLPYWREAYEQSAGLTLEFTYLLTQGRRLGDVIGDQIQRRVTEERADELAVLALVSVADQWSASLRVERVADCLEGDDARLRQAIGSLANEHLLVERDGAVSGLHPVRSAAIADAIHSLPPPTLRTTVSRLLPLIADEQLPRFIAQALRHQPELAEVVVEAGLNADRSASRVAAFLQGLRRADSEHATHRWVEILTELNVPRSIQMPVVLFAIADLDFGDLPIRDDVRRALDEIAGVPAGDLRDELADRLGPDMMSRLVFDSRLDEATALLATLHGWVENLDVPAHCSILLEQLDRAPSDAAGDVLAALRRHSVQLMSQVVDRLGGEEWALERLRAENPWLLDLAVHEGDEGPVGFARLLHVDDALGSPRERCVALARTLLRHLPSIVATDVEALLPGGQRMEIAGHNHSMSGLLRRYDHDRTEQAWSQTRASGAQARLGAPDTVRLAAAEPIIRELSGIVRETCNRWARQEPRRRRDQELGRSLRRLYSAGEDLPPRISPDDGQGSGITDTDNLSMGDALSSAVTQSAQMVARIATEDNFTLLSAFVRDHVIKHLRESLEEPWDLISTGGEAEIAVGQLLNDAWAVHDVLRARALGEAASARVVSAAQQGSIRFALSRAAECARDLLEQTQEERRRELLTALQAAMPDWPIDVLASTDQGLSKFAVIVESPPLHEWASHEGAIQAAVGDAQQQFESFVVVALRDGQRIPGFGLRLIQTWVPLTDLDRWEQQLPPPRQMTLAPLVNDASAALQVLSGLADLSEEQRRHAEVIDVADRANQRLDAAIETLGERRGDEFVDNVLEFITALAERVQTELGGQTRGSTLAAAVSAGMFGAGTDDWEMLVGISVLAIEWEVDPEGVRQLLNW